MFSDKLTEQTHPNFIEYFKQISVSSMATGEFERGSLPYIFSGLAFVLPSNSYRCIQGDAINAMKAFG